MSNVRHYMAVIDNLIVDITKEMDSMTSLELTKIKREARFLYENLVWLTYEAVRKEK